MLRVMTLLEQTCELHAGSVKSSVVMREFIVHLDTQAIQTAAISVSDYSTGDTNQHTFRYMLLNILLVVHRTILYEQVSKDDGNG